MGVAYCVLGWLVIQITDTVAPALRLPDWTLTVVTWFGVIGLPFALLFAWAFEMTPDGIKRTEDVSPEESVTTATGRWLTRVTFGLMAAAIVILLVDRQGLFSGDQAATPEVPVTAAPAEPAALEEQLESIAVLPFVNMSSDRENQFFGDGLAEEILNQLAAIEELRVAARTSSFYFRDKDPTISEVAEALNVDAVLEGSIQRAGNTIRVVAQLIRASDSAHLWSSKYDRPLDDYFEVQDDIANHIMRAMMPHLAVEQASASQLESLISPEVFEQLALAKKQYYDEALESMPQLREQFAEVTRAAPDYAPGWSWLAMSWLTSSSAFGGDVAVETAREAAVANIDRALELDPQDPMAHHAMGRLQWRMGNYDAAEQWYRKALELDPQNVGATLGLGNLLSGNGRPEEALQLLERARLIDPLHPMVLWDLIHLYGLSGEDHAAFSALERMYSINASQAYNAEIHLYADRNDLAREIYLIEVSRNEEAVSAGPVSANWEALSMLRAGLYSHPLIAGSSFEPLALALQGDGEAAETLLLQQQLADSDNFFDQLNSVMTHMVAGRYDAAETLLWQGWVDNDRKISSSFRSWMAELLLSVLLRQERPEAEEVRQALAAELAQASPLHSGNLKIDLVNLATFSGEEEKALDLLQGMVDEGYWGGRHMGSAGAALWPLHDKPRFAELVAGMEKNYQYQLAELERLRNADMTLAEFHRDYLNRIGRYPTATDP
ncbi:tetratricopeptide repeat protein [Seongchinamella sediminis]|uniref:Tetratricopeptide repeat protein n=1 Tax=Seongchinamella sediminis TaxID=2283635 RepID=A0A3L7E0W2_9GAMM|nr:tetratricopeptide repeat protein [Seongchinamella sediminis]